MVEIYRTDIGDVIADVGCREDKQRLMTSGIARPKFGLPSAHIVVLNQARDSVLPYPPTSQHRRALTDLRFATLTTPAFELLGTHLGGPPGAEFGASA